jgi:lipopolysaccharide biosynthesis protein
MNVKAIAFYLPQFHPIPENDRWWGKGFTEWTNVAQARPLFPGHYQPHIPADLGFYDLRLEETRIAQAELAREYGIYGFCYYHYWFNEKMLLERPFNEVLASGKPDFPFCLCWANENWTRAWDGLERDVLISQDYANYDVSEHFEWLQAAFSDPRYIRIDNKPLFLIYRADQIPDLRERVRQMREAGRLLGHDGLYLCAVKNTQFSLSDRQAIDAGFDALIDFQPNSKQIPLIKRDFPENASKFSLKNIRNLFLRRKPDYGCLSYQKFVQTIIDSPLPEQKTFPSVFPSWDNSPRRNSGPTIIQNDDAALFGKLLSSSISKVQKYPAEERLVFINAWNEWAEGCHLEPDLRNGRKFLQAVKNALENSTKDIP